MNEPKCIVDREPRRAFSEIDFFCRLDNDTAVFKFMFDEHTGRMLYNDFGVWVNIPDTAIALRNSIPCVQNNGSAVSLKLYAGDLIGTMTLTQGHIDAFWGVYDSTIERWKKEVEGK